MKSHRHGLCFLCMIFAVVFVFGSAVPSMASTTEGIIFKYLTTKMGFNSAAACGILANIEFESGFNPNIYGDGGTSYGICQWHASRFENLKRYCADNGLDYTTLDGQLAFLNYELSSMPGILNNIRSVANSADGAYDAGHYWCMRFEIPADTENQARMRGETARTKYWPIFGDGGQVVEPEGPYEVWIVTADKLNVRSGPGTNYPVQTAWTRENKLQITETALNTATGVIWGKTRLGWSDMSYMKYDSGSLYSVKYSTGCARAISDVPVHTGMEYTLAYPTDLVRNGYTFKGWRVGRELLSAGETLTITGDIRVVGEWERDESVTLICADANCDGKINAADVLTVLKHLAGIESAISLPCADIDRSGKINAKDVTLLMKIMVGSASVDLTVSAEDEARWK